MAVISCCCSRIGLHPAFLHAWHVWPLTCAKLPFLCLTSKLFYIKGQQARVKNGHNDNVPCCTMQGLNLTHTAFSIGRTRQTTQTKTSPKRTCGALGDACFGFSALTYFKLGLISPHFSTGGSTPRAITSSRIFTKWS